MNDKMEIFIFSVNVINRLLSSFMVLTKVITFSGVHCNYSMTSARSLIEPEMMLISKKKRSTHAISALTPKLAQILARDMLWICHILKYFKGARTY